MTDLRDAARQALEALETVFMPHHPAVIALKAALAEEALQRLTDVHQEMEAALEQPEDPMREAKALAQAYENGWNAAQPQEQPEQDKFCDSHCTWRDHHPDCVRAEQPQRTLTDEVIANLWHANGGFHHHFARAIERWLRGQA